MTVSGPSARRPARAGLAGPGATLSGSVRHGAALSGVLVSGVLLCGAVLSAAPAGATPAPAVLVGAAAAGPPPSTARPIGRNPFVPLVGPGAPAPAADRVEPVLRRGDTGDAVRRLQQGLVPLPAGGPGELAVDGVFGPRTAAAVGAFQSAHGLVPDGLVGPRTWGALAAAGGR